MRATIVLSALALALMMPGVCWARLGETREQVLARYGKPTEEVTLASGIKSLRFQIGKVRMIVEVAGEKAIQIYYFKETPWTPAQVKEILMRNSEGCTWTEGDSELDWRGSDGRRSRGSNQAMKTADDRRPEYMLAILRGSGVKLTDEQVKELKEIEGL